MAFLLEDRDDAKTAAAVVTDIGSLVRYVTLDHVYSTTSPFSMFKKVTAGKVVLGLCAVEEDGDADRNHRRRKWTIVPRPCGGENRPRIFKVYSRHSKRPETALVAGAETAAPVLRKRKREKMEIVGELVKVGVNSERQLGLRGCRNHYFWNGVQRKKMTSEQSRKKVVSDSAAIKRWIRLSFDGADPNLFVGLKCKIYWPIDADWYSGRAVGYDSETNQHHVKYEDGDTEKLILSNERIKFHISRKEMQRLNLSSSHTDLENEIYDYDEMVVLATCLDDYQEVEAGDIIWAKLTGT